MENIRKVFEERLFQLMNRYPYALENKTRFLELIEDQTFIDENVEMYNSTADVWFLEPLKKKANYEIFLNEFERFIEKWKTPPLNSWLFRDEKYRSKERLSVGRQSQGTRPRHPATAGRKPYRNMAYFFEDTFWLF